MSAAPVVAARQMAVENWIPTPPIPSVADMSSVELPGMPIVITGVPVPIVQDVASYTLMNRVAVAVFVTQSE